ncbi:MAG: HAMP domain-containing protein [Anaerolineales bacterium]|nr:HAMP domain-containing protein [Anaerolineales bacterium]
MPEQKTEPRKQPVHFVSLRLKIWIGFTLIFTPVFIASYFWFFEYTSQRVFQTITDNLMETINGAVKGMDKEGFQELYAEESADNPLCPPAKDAPADQNGYYPEDNPLYIAHENWLEKVQNIKPQTRIYTYIKGLDAGEIIAIGSTGYFREPRGGFKFCQRYTSSSSNIYQGLTTRTDAWEAYTDSFGTWITTYAPIIDDSGKTVGGIGVDIDSSYVNQVRDEILKKGTLAFVVSYGLIFLLVYWLSGFMTRPIIGLAGVAKQIGEGDYSSQFLDKMTLKNSRDEIDTLGDVFKIMVDKVAKREESLRVRVKQLEIMVDKSKLAEQVSEIVDSDFFQDLQTKVKGMRERFEKGDDKE